MDANLASTWLFVPGNRPDRFEKARASGADEVILDLEDSVTPEHKPAARREVAKWLDHRGSAWVRINASGTPWFSEDVADLVQRAGLRGFVLPKAELPATLTALGSQLRDRGLIALIESARGARRAEDIAECDAVTRLAFGSIDFAADIGASECAQSLLFARSTLVLASRSADKPPPLDGVTTNLTDHVVAHNAATEAKRLGIGGKLCIHPAQIGPVAAAFWPSALEVAWARDVVNRSGGRAGVRGPLPSTAS